MDSVLVEDMMITPKHGVVAVTINKIACLPGAPGN